VKNAKPPRLGVQLYCLRDDCAKDLAGTIGKAAEMGYDGVEFAGYFGHPAREIRKMLSDSGIAVAGTHIPFETLLGDELMKTVDFNLETGNSLLIVPGLREEHRSSLDAWKRTAGTLNDIASKIAGQGLRLGYHNHTVEFAKMDGQVPYELLFSLTRPEFLMQLDLGLAEEAGMDAVGLLKRYPGRGYSIHAKEYSRTKPDAYIGEGDVRWGEIIRTCAEVSGTEWYIVEYEMQKGDAFENLRTCLENFRRLFRAEST